MARATDQFTKPAGKAQSLSYASMLGQSRTENNYNLMATYLLGNGSQVFSCCHGHDGAVGRLAQERDAAER